MTTWITATPPTPNGPLHLGHVAGPYLAGDVMARALVANGETACFSTGLDDHQSYVPRRAWGSGLTAEQVADKFSNSIVQTWDTAHIRFDEVVHPHGATYARRVQEMFSRLLDSGCVVRTERALPFCTTCDLWLYEAHLLGRCPHCEARTNGNACEDCARPNTCADVLDPTCTRCGAVPELRQTALHVLDLEPLRDGLKGFWESCDMPERLRAVCRGLAAQRLPEVLVSHPSDWGVPVPQETTLRIYVWLEMAEGYAIQAPAAGHDDLVQFFGIDNGFFHAVLFPAVNLALGREELLPDRFVVNEFLQLNGSKFSTSRRHAVWASEFLPVVGADLLRLHCLLRRPSTRRSDFTLADFSRTEKMLDGWNDTFLDVLRLPRPEIRGDVTSTDLRRLARSFAAHLDLALRSCLPDDFDPAVAVAQLGGAVSVLRAATDEVRCLEGVAQVGAAAEVLRTWVREFAVAAGPVVPFGSNILLQACASQDVPERIFGLGAA